MLRIILVTALLFFPACAATPYKYGNNYFDTPKTLAAGEKQIERGEEYVLIDGIRHYFFSLPAKLLLWNWKIDSYKIDEDNEKILAGYLAENNLTDVKIRINEYDPLGEFSRLFKNKKVGWGWRYTVGLLGCAFYTIFPGRVFGGDNYNPYTDTINVYSNHPSVLLHEAGHARDFAEIEHKGSWAFLSIIPGFNLHDEYEASSEALSYAVHNNNKDLEKKSYKILYPAFGTYVGGDSSVFLPSVRPFSILFAIPGHIIGRIRTGNVKEDDNSVR